MSNVKGGLRQGRQSIDATSAGGVYRHSPPPFVDRCCVVAKVARAISLASAGLFSNDHSRADLPLAGTGRLLVVNINQPVQRPSPDTCPPPVLLERHHTFCPVSAIAATARRQLRRFSRVLLSK
jgi:hypothetical protein